MKENLSKWGRTILGIFLILYALNQFLHFAPTSYGTMPEDAQNFLDAVVMYLPFLYVFEIIIGFLLLFNLWSAFILIVLFPLSVSFLIFMFAEGEFSETWPALFVAVLNIALLVNSKDRYTSLFLKEG